VLLRPFVRQDIAFFASLACDERVTRFVGDGRPWGANQILDRTQPALRRKPVEEVGAARWFIAEEGQHRVGLLVSTRRKDAVEVGYWVAPENWGRGIAGTMLDWAVDALPGIFGTTELCARVSPGNTASERLLIRRSFEYQSHDEGLNLYSRTQ
jgi:RimJ/RimL family protein N-acetyltransferase